MTTPDPIPNVPIGEGINYPNPTDTASPRFYSSTVVKRQVSLGSSQKVGIRTVNEDGVAENVDSILLRVLDREALVHTYEEISNPEVGTYEVVIGPPVTGTRRHLTLMWTYTKDSNTIEFSDEIVVLERMPTYETLSDAEKGVVEQINWLFDDLFDSTEGGAFLAENFQSHFNYERLAQLTLRAVQKINMSNQPITNYAFGGGGTGSRYPSKYYSVLISAAYLEVLRHLIRSYVEIPDFRGMSTTYTDRRDYINRWRMVLDEEKEDVAKAITLMKREHLNLGGGALLVSGGMFGSSGRTAFYPGVNNAMARGSRMYPTAPLIRF